MRLPTTLTCLAAAALVLSACSSSRNDDTPIDDIPLLSDALPVPKDTGESERFVIRDKQQRVRVDGRTNNGRMSGTWIYYDSYGEKLAVVNYQADQRNGGVELYYVTADGPAVKRLRMKGAYAAGAQNGTFESRWPSGAKKQERDFDQGMLKSARGWDEKGTALSTAEAERSAIADSRAEEALLTELENFVQLQMRTQGDKKSKGGEDVPDVRMEVPRTDPSAIAPYPGGTPPLAPP